MPALRYDSVAAIIRCACNQGKQPINSPLKLYGLSLKMMYRRMGSCAYNIHPWSILYHQDLSGIAEINKECIHKNEWFFFPQENFEVKLS